MYQCVPLTPQIVQHFWWSEMQMGFLCTSNNPLTWFSYACSVVIVYIHNQLTDLDLKVCFSLLSYCIIIVFDRLECLRTQDSHARALTGMHTRRNTWWQVQAEWRAAVVFPALLFINLSNAIKDRQQEWQTEKEREEKEEIVIHSHSQMWLRPCILNLTSSLCPITLRLAFCCCRNVCRPFAGTDAWARTGDTVRRALGTEHSTLSSCHLACPMNHTPECFFFLHFQQSSQDFSDPAKCHTLMK